MVEQLPPTPTPAPGYEQLPPVNPPVATPVSRTNSLGLGIASLILGILSLCGSPVLFCGLILSLVGIVLGALGLNTRGRTMAIAGIVLSVIGILLTIVLRIVLRGAFFTNYFQQLLHNYGY